MAKSDKTKEPAIQTSAEVTKIKVQQDPERTKAVDDLVLTCIKRQKGSDATWTAVMLGASQLGINSAATFFLKQQDFSCLASLAKVKGLSDSVMNDIALAVYSHTWFQNPDIMNELTKSQSIVNGMIRAYIRKLNVYALRKTVSYRKRNKKLELHEIATLIDHACEEGNILVAREGAELRQRELTTEEIKALTEAIKKQQKTKPKEKPTS